MSTPPTIIPDRALHPSHVFAAHLLLAQHRDLPAPTSITVTDAGAGNTHVDLAVDSAARVDAWAEAMGVDVDSELHNDGTWTDEARGQLEITSGRANQWTERVSVAVHSPQTTTAHPVAGPPVDCEHAHPGETGAEVADRIIHNMALRTPGVDL